MEDTPVFTTKYVIEENSPIVFISHDDDGSLQFHGIEEDFTTDDAKVVSLAEIVKLDETVKEVLDKIPIGYEAHRDKIVDDWEIFK